MSLHIFSHGPWQSMSRYRNIYLEDIDPDGRQVWITPDPTELYECHECWGRRPASELKIGVSYDTFTILCADECYTGARRARLAAESAG